MRNPKIKKIAEAIICILVVLAILLVLVDREIEADAKTRPTVKVNIPTKWNAYINKVAKANKYDSNLIRGIIQQESSWDPKCVYQGNYGLCQINRCNFNSFGAIMRKKYGKFDIFNPYQNIDCLILELNKIQNAYKRAKHRLPDTRELLLSYNRGIAGARRYIASRGGFNDYYYRRVLQHKKQYQSLGRGK